MGMDFQGIDSSYKSGGLNFSGIMNPFANNVSHRSFVQNKNSESKEEVTVLNEKLNSVMDDQGIFSKGWNEFKEIVNVGTNEEKCHYYIEQYEKGEITFDEAMAKIEEFDAKQDSSLNLFSNIASSFAAIAAGTVAVIASGGTAAPLLVAAAAGAGAGAAAKATVKFADRATNEVKNDALDAKQITKDALSGAVTGAIAAATMGNGTAGATLKESVALSAGKAARTGVITGTVSGSSNYVIDCAFDDDKDFNAKEFAEITAQSAAIGGVVGGIMGSVNGTLRYNNFIEHGGMVKACADSVQNASTKDIVANSVCSAEYKVVNDRIRSIAA